MSQILTAIDAEIEQEDARLDELRTAVARSELHVEGLHKLRESAAALNGAGSEPEPEPSKPTPPKSSKRRSAAKPKPRPEPAGDGGGKSPTDQERKQRSSLAEERQAKVLAYVREHGAIAPGQAADLLKMSGTNAATFLKSLAAHGKTSLRRYEVVPGNPRRGVVYRLEMAPAGDDGAKTKPERRVVEAVRKDGPIDEGTLAFNAQLSTTDLRSVASALVRRGVLKRWDEDGVTLFGRGG